MITSKDIKPNGMVAVWDGEAGKFIDMAPIDAKHALEVEPDRYALTEPVAPVVEPEPDDKFEGDEQ